VLVGISTDFFLRRDAIFCVVPVMFERDCVWRL